MSTWRNISSTTQNCVCGVLSQRTEYFLCRDAMTSRLLVSQIIQLILKQDSRHGWRKSERGKKRPKERKGKTKEKGTCTVPNASLTQRCSYLMLIIKAGFEHGRRFCYFPTPLEPSPCDSPPLHPGKLSA